MGNFKGTKKKIYEVAIKLFAKKGYKATSMREIAKEVGIAVSAIYNHFKSKEEILDAIIKDLEQSNLTNIFEGENIEDTYHKGKSVLKRISNMFKLISYDTKSDLLFRFMMQELFVNEKIAHFYNEVFYQENVKKLSKVFFLMMQDDMIISADPLLLANEFFSTLFFYQMQIVRLKAENKSTATMATFFEKHTDFFWDRIKNKKVEEY